MFLLTVVQSLYLILQNCEINVLPGDNYAVITAHGRKNAIERGGYSFVHCKVIGSGGNAHLGRAWFEAARVIFSYCDISDVIKSDGWSDNNKPQVQKYANLFPCLIALATPIYHLFKFILF